MKSFFICIGLNSNNEIVSRNIEESDKNQAIESFKKDFGEPKEVLGPFFKKKDKKQKYNLVKIKFSTTDSSKKALYNNWLVNAFLLREPKDSAYLIFLSNTKDNSLVFPNKPIIVNIKDLKEYTE